MVGRHDKVLLRRVNIVKWDSDASHEAEQEFSLKAIPLVCVFDGKGIFLGKFVGADPKPVEDAVQGALSR